MAPKHGSLSEMMAAQLGQAAEKPAASKSPTKAKVVQLAQPQGESASTAPQQITEKVTLYLPREVYRFIKQTALELDKRPHDLLMQGVELMLSQHGKSLKDFGK